MPLWLPVKPCDVGVMRGEPPGAVRAVQWDATWQGVERPSEAEIEGRA
mgnify:CR=1 FL=1